MKRLFDANLSRVQSFRHARRSMERRRYNTIVAMVEATTAEAMNTKHAD
jgi:hypothetical protein